MAALQLPDIVLTTRCRTQMQLNHIAISEVLGTLNTPKRIRKANPTSLTDSVWRAETNGVRAYYRWSSHDHKWIILSCWRYNSGRIGSHSA
jgi:hypothetical protein